MSGVTIWLRISKACTRRTQSDTSRRRGNGSPLPPPLPQANAADGERLYRRDCANCHSADGTDAPRVAAELQTASAGP